MAGEVPLGMATAWGFIEGLLDFLTVVGFWEVLSIEGQGFKRKRVSVCPLLATYELKVLLGEYEPGRGDAVSGSGVIAPHGVHDAAIEWGYLQTRLWGSQTHARQHAGTPVGFAIGQIFAQPRDEGFEVEEVMLGLPQHRTAAVGLAAWVDQIDSIQ